MLDGNRQINLNTSFFWIFIDFFFICIAPMPANFSIKISLLRTFEPIIEIYAYSVWVYGLGVFC